MLAAALGASARAAPGSAPAASGTSNVHGFQLGSWRGEYDHSGLFLFSPGDRVVLHPQLRFQTRLWVPFDDDPRSVEALRDEEGFDYTLNRSRFKLGLDLATAQGDTWLSIYHEVELRGPRVLDLRASFERSERLRLRVGQWKPEYNRERRDSSGTQQFVERSIVNREFTLDRQLGAMLYGRVGKARRFDTSWWLGLFGGSGRGAFNDGGQPLFMGRLQWNLLGRVLGFSQSDLERRAEPAASLAVGLAHNRSRYTRFSSDGGGQLDGFEPGESDQYALLQAMAESAFQWRGFSWQQELHWKQVHDRMAGGRTDLVGGYAQIGYFFHGSWSRVPGPLELALRAAALDPDTGRSDDGRQELTLAANWFFNGHRNKLTLDGSWLRIDDGRGADSGFRVRLQWDVSF